MKDKKMSINPKNQFGSDQNQANLKIDASSKFYLGDNALWSFAIGSFILSGILYFIFMGMPDALPIHVLGTWIFLGIPIWLVLTCNSSIRVLKQQDALLSKSKISQVFFGVTVRLVLYGIIAFVASGLALANFLIFQLHDWVLLLMALVTLGLFYRHFLNKPYEFDDRRQIKYVARTHAVYASLLFFMFASFVIKNLMIGSVIDTKSIDDLFSVEFKSEVANRFYWYYIYLDHPVTFAFNVFGSTEFNAKIVSTLIELIFKLFSSIGIFAIFSIFLLPLQDFKWFTSNPMALGAEEQKAKPMYLALLSAFTVIIILFIMLPAFISAEQQFYHDPLNLQVYKEE